MYRTLLGIDEIERSHANTITIFTKLLDKLDNSTPKPESSSVTSDIAMIHAKLSDFKDAVAGGALEVCSTGEFRGEITGGEWMSWFEWIGYYM
jgi:hypothetical protein